MKKHYEEIIAELQAKINKPQELLNLQNRQRIKKMLKNLLKKEFLQD